LSDEHPDERRSHQQLQCGAAEAVLRLERGGDGARQEDLVDLEEQAKPDRDDHLAVDPSDGEIVETASDVGQPDLAVGLCQCCGHFESPLPFESLELLLLFWSFEELLLALSWPCDESLLSLSWSPDERLLSLSWLQRSSWSRLQKFDRPSWSPE